MAWTITEAFRHYNSGNKVITLSMTSDASVTDYAIVTYINEIKGMFLYLVKCTPGTGGDAPAGTYDLDIEDANNDHLLDTDANANNAQNWHEGSATLGRDPMIMDALSVVVATLGNGNKTTIQLMFSRYPQVT